MVPHRYQRINQPISEGPALNDRSITHNSLYEQPPPSDHPTSNEVGNELAMPGCVTDLPLFDLSQCVTIDEPQTCANMFDQNRADSSLVDSSVSLCPEAAFSSYQASDLSPDISGMIEAELPSGWGKSQQLSTQNIDQVPFNSSKLSEVLRINDGVSQNFTLEDILIAGISAISRGDKRRKIVTQMTDTSTNQEAYTQQIPTPQTHLGQFQIPDIHVNTIQLTAMSFIAACFANAAVLGLSREALWDKTAQSPFYETQMANGRLGITSTERFAHLKPLLRPSSTQRSHPHHPYLDILPFPTFRNRTIQLLQIQPLPFDPDLLCQDLRNDGIICWGSTRPDSRDNRGTGAPWDIRSWELKSWFLKKWWILFDGPDDELSQSSQWWCEMRGEKSSA